MKKSCVLMEVLIVMALISGCGGVSVEQKVNEIEVGSQNIKWEDYVTVKDQEKYGIASVDDSAVDLNTLGEYKVTYTFENKSNNQTEDKTFTFAVKDTTAPEIIFMQDPLSVSLGDEIDPLDYVDVKDNYDGAIDKDSILVDSTVDTSKKGTYAIKYTVSDAAKNQAEATLQVEVTDKPIGLNEVITSDNHGELTLTETAFETKVVPHNPSMFYHYYEVKSDDQIYLTVYGTFKNLETENVSLDEMLTISALYNGQYKYKGFVVEENAGNIDAYSFVDPLETVKFICLIEVPLEVSNSGQPLELKIQLKGKDASSRYMIR